MKFVRAFGLGTALICIGMPAATKHSAFSHRSLDREKSAASSVIPFRFDPHLCPCPLIKLTIDGKPPLYFGLDTGIADSMIIRPQFAKTLGIKPIGSASIFLFPHGASLAFAAQPSHSIEIVEEQTTKRLHVRPSNLYIAELPVSQHGRKGPEMAGLIGLSLFRYPAFTLDFVKCNLTLWDRSPPRSDRSDAIRLPMMKHGGSTRSITLTMEARDSHRFMIDTGSSLTELPSSVQSACIPIAATRSHASVNDVVVTETAFLLPTIGFGARKEPDIVVYFNKTAPVEYINKTIPTALLGIDLLSRFRVTIDLQRNELELLSAANYADRRRQSGADDIFVEGSEHPAIVRDVKSGSPAAIAGVCAKDRLIAIDGKSVQGLALTEIEMLLDGQDGLRASLRMERGNHILKVISYIRRSIFSSPRPIGIGIAVERKPEGHVAIIRLPMHSPALDAGLQIGDQVIEVNGIEVLHASMEQLGSEITKPIGSIIRLTMLRPGETKQRRVRLVVRRLNEPL